MIKRAIVYIFHSVKDIKSDKISHLLPRGNICTVPIITIHYSYTVISSSNYIWMSKLKGCRKTQVLL